MPTTYAHYRFGCDVFAAMPTDLREIVEKHRQLFDFGVHGPDLLFYDKPFSSTRINAIGYASHERTGADFFAQAVKALKASTQKEAALSYLLGVLCHFALDRECHPYVAEKEQTGASHSEIESSFDRYLMEKDGLDPLRHKVTKHLIPSLSSALVIADFYPPLTAKEIYHTEKSMVFYLNGLIAPPGPKRKAILAGLKAAGHAATGDMMIPLRQNPKCWDSDKILWGHYQDALKLIETLRQELFAYIRDGSPLGLSFYHTFGAE